MFLEVEIFDFLPAGHDAGSAAETDVVPLGVDVAVVDGADVLCLRCKSRHFVAAAVVIVIRHCVGEATDDGFGYVYHSKSVRIVEGGSKGLTFVLRLRGSGVACDKILVVIRSNGFEIHGSRDVQQDHGIIHGSFGRVKRYERGWHDLL